MRLVRTSRPNWPDTLNPIQRYQAYNALDCCVTAEVYESLRTRFDPDSLRIYQFELACQQPAMAMQLRGIRIDPLARKDAIKLVEKEGKALHIRIEEMAVAMRGKGFKYGKGLPPSTFQVQDFLYDDLGVPMQRNRDGKRSANKECLTRIVDKYEKGAPFARIVLSLRDWEEQRKKLKSGLSADGRMRSSFNVGAAETGRWSSSKNCYAEGGNAQNIDHRLRNIFIADPGMELIYADLEQAESYCIAHVAGDTNYIEEHQRGNVHVEMAHLFWPEITWTGDAAANKKMLKHTAVPWIKQEPVASGQAPAFSYYDMSKRAQHGMNYGLTYQGLAKWLGCKQREAKLIHIAYFNQHPYVLEYHNYIAAELKRVGSLTTPFGRPRQFLGRAWDRATVREAIAHVPQSMTGDVLNIGLLRAWQQLDPGTAKLSCKKGEILLLAQVHDAILCERNIGDEDALEKLLSLMNVEVPVTDYQGETRMMVIPVEAEIGKNWRDM